MLPGWGLVRKLQPVLQRRSALPHRRGGTPWQQVPHARGMSAAGRAPAGDDDDAPGFELKSGPPGSGLLLKDKWALVTGASQGIGRAVAEAFAGEGASVILHAHPLNADSLGKAAKHCEALGAPEVHTVEANLVLPKEVDKVAAEMLKICGRCDILVNNAGKYKPMTLDRGHNQGQGPLDGDPDEWDAQTMLNLAAPMRLTRHLLPTMVDRGAGWMFNIASAEALGPFPSAPAYAATKWGLRGWSLSCFEYLRHKKIHVMVVNPGPTSTPATWRQDAAYDPDLLIQPHEVAQAMLMALSTKDNTAVEEITMQPLLPPEAHKR